MELQKDEIVRVWTGLGAPEDGIVLWVDSEEVAVGLADNREMIVGHDQVEVPR